MFLIREVRDASRASLPRFLRAVLLVGALPLLGCAGLSGSRQGAEESAQALASHSPDGVRGASGQVAVSFRESFYQIEGATPRQLTRALNEKGPLSHGSGSRAFGQTRFELRYRYEPSPWSDGCRAAGASVEVELVTTLPAWSGRDRAAPVLRADWDLFIGRLRAHEHGHRRIAVELGERLLERLQALRASDCRVLRVAVRRLERAFVSAADLEHRAWDQETRHGLMVHGS